MLNLFAVSVCPLSPTVRVADLNSLELVLDFSDFMLNLGLGHPDFVSPDELFYPRVFDMALLIIKWEVKRK